MKKPVSPDSGLFGLFLWADVMGIDILVILQEHFLIVSQDQWEENVAGEFVAKQTLVFFCRTAGRANRFSSSILTPVDW